MVSAPFIQALLKISIIDLMKQKIDIDMDAPEKRPFCKQFKMVFSFICCCDRFKTKEVNDEDLRALYKFEHYYSVAHLVHMVKDWQGCAADDHDSDFDNCHKNEHAL